MSENAKTYYGKYRATVTNNVDPMQSGRLMLSVPDVLGEIPSSWAEPCVPLAGPTGPPMGIFLVPAIGTPVWAEFEQGDPDHPIWSGCRWGSTSSIPSLALASNPADPDMVFQSLLQHSLTISDLPPTPATGGIILKSTTGAMIVVNDSGIYINNGKGATVELVGPSVLINTAALTVT
jgi:uncharacterized protein involved in type VI secretion and phage assembly